MIVKIQKQFLVLILIVFWTFNTTLFAQAVKPVIPSPADFLGFSAGQSLHLASPKQIDTYFRLLDDASSRLRVQELGKTTEGKSLILAIISSPENFKNAAGIIETQRKLSDPHDLIDAQAKLLIRKAKVVVSINCSIHPMEVGPSQMSMQLAYELVSGTSKLVESILEDTIILLIPAHNPDGLDKVVNWYYKYQGTQYEGGPLPFLDHKYSGHDINRDWVNLSQPESRLTVEKVYNVWRPQIVLDLHQMGYLSARMFVPPYIDPYDEMLHPIVHSLLNAIGSEILVDMTLAGHSGVATNIFFDAYSPTRAYVNYHGGMRILAEIASVKLASPIEIKSEQLLDKKSFYPNERAWNYPLPWPGGSWSLEQIVDYGKTACFSVLDYAVNKRQELLYYFYKVAYESINDEDNQVSFLIPPNQFDFYALDKMLNILQSGMVNVYKAVDEFVADETLYPAGTFIIPGDQPYASYARTLLEDKQYPSRNNNGHVYPIHPYDVTTNNLQYMLGVKVITIKGQVNGNFQKVDQIIRKSVIPARNGNNGFFIDYRHLDAVKFIQNLFDQNVKVYWLAETIKAGGNIYPPGTLWMPGVYNQVVKDLADSVPVVISNAPSFKKKKAYQLVKPAIGLYQSYQAIIDEGWTRFIFDEFNIPYLTIKNEDIKSGNLAAKFDVIILPDQSVEKIIAGLDSTAVPGQYTGGIGDIGIQQLKDFVLNGGVLVTLGNASLLPLQHFWVEAKNVVNNINKSEYYVPGSMLKSIVDQDDPIGYGMQRETPIFNYNSPAFELVEGNSVVSYPGGNLLLSGWLTGEQHIALKTAVGEIPYGQGSVILMGIRPQFRAQTVVTFKLLFNSILKSSAILTSIP